MKGFQKNQASDPKGLLHCLPLLKGLIKLEPTCEIHGSSLGQGLFQLLVAEPALNDTPWNGSVWLGMKVERVTSLLYHMRRLKGSQSEMATCAAKLTGGEYLQLQEVAKLIKKKDAERGESTRKLKKEISEVSLDSEGYPLSLRSPPKPLVKGKGNEKEATELQQPSFKRKRKGSFGAKPAPEEEHSSLKTAWALDQQ